MLKNDLTFTQKASSSAFFIRNESTSWEVTKLHTPKASILYACYTLNLTRFACLLSHHCRWPKEQNPFWYYYCIVLYLGRLFKAIYIYISRILLPCWKAKPCFSNTQPCMFWHNWPALVEVSMLKLSLLHNMQFSRELNVTRSWIVSIQFTKLNSGK